MTFYFVVDSQPVYKTTSVEAAVSVKKNAQYQVRLYAVIYRG